jgi:hypothetical protein
MKGKYEPKKSSWGQALKQALEVGKKTGGELVNMRVARGGCFVARYLRDIKKIKGIEADVMYEIKIYDNMPYLKNLKNVYSIRG